MISNLSISHIEIKFYRTECFCGNSISEDAIKLPDPECNYKCSGDSKQLCGGYFTISIFETGIKSKKYIFTIDLNWL